MRARIAAERTAPRAAGGEAEPGTGRPEHRPHGATRQGRSRGRAAEAGDPGRVRSRRPGGQGMRVRANPRVAVPNGPRMRAAVRPQVSLATSAAVQPQATRAPEPLALQGLREARWRGIAREARGEPRQVRRISAMANSQEKRYDAIVVGARCAGSPTAMLLARKGHRVLLVDRATFPSDTVSTHVVHPRAAALLARWGLLERLVATGCPPIHTYAFDFGPVTISGAPGTADSPVAYCPRRTVLDELLVRAAAEAGVEVREGFTVDEVLSEDGRVVGVVGRSAQGAALRERARVVVGADGRFSRVAQAVRPERYQAPTARWWSWCPPWPSACGTRSGRPGSRARRWRTTSTSSSARGGCWSGTPATTRTRSRRRASWTRSATPSAARPPSTRTSPALGRSTRRWARRSASGTSTRCPCTTSPAGSPRWRPRRPSCSSCSAPSRATSPPWTPSRG